MSRKIKTIHLQWIAMIAMFIDHLGFVFGSLFPEYYGLCRIIGRLAFPLYCFMLAKGVVYTSNRKKYGLRLLLAAVVSEPCFDLMISGMVWNIEKQNVMWTLLIGYLLLCVWEQQSGWYGRIGALVCGCYLATLFHTDYGCTGVLFSFFFYLFVKGRIKHNMPLQISGFLGFCAVNYAGMGRVITTQGVLVEGITMQSLLQPVRQDYAILAWVLILLCSLERAEKKTAGVNKAFRWFRYGFYPIHMLVLYCMKLVYCAIL